MKNNKSTNNDAINFNIISKEKTLELPTEISESNACKVAKREQKQSITILGDSVVKYVNGYEPSQQLKNAIVYVKSFPGARIRCMSNYAKPGINPDHIILHIGSNDLRTKKKSDEIAGEIMELATSLKNHACEVSILNKTAKNDHPSQHKSYCSKS